MDRRKQGEVAPMPRKPNYRFERAERNRAKAAKKEEKLRRQQERLSTPADDEPPQSTAEPPADEV
jgi:hypothetical protein